MDRDTKNMLWFGGAILGALLLIGVLATGPANIVRKFNSWYARSYGSDWLVCQYAQDGYLIASWELHDRAIGNEGDSDGIFFTDDSGHVVHLSGNYVYVQVAGGDWDGVRERFVVGRVRKFSGD